MATVFFVSFGLVVYHVIFYPIILFAATSLKPYGSRQIADISDLPVVEMIVPAHNEQVVISKKIRNIRALDYPREKLIVTVALDGCSDGTEKVLADELAVQAWENDRFTVVVYRQNIGKVAVLNELISRSTAEIIALSDASALLDVSALKKAAQYFSDKRIGVVCGAYRLSTASSFAEHAYWRYQTYIKRLESSFGSVMGAHGAFYLFRRSLWTSLPGDTINDDFVLPMKIVAAGARAIYAPEIGVEELEVSRSTQDIRRRIRLGAGNVQQLLMLSELADPRTGRTAFMFISGKALRSIVPYALIAAFVSGLTCVAIGNPILATCIAAVCGLVLVLPVFLPGASGILGLARYIALSNIAAALGGLVYLLGPKGAAWNVSRKGKRA
ncbi:glycosyltransferase family 2 protein [Aminobacter anthyllidis]|uniref:Glycosyltransferase family 2 protein n=1 Tax=Aminobacter anthyllidis TaxID=1035067 RepID=A0A9X1AGK2_9HYPH|nr:glycosyltransferase family 2 protein [Aminobacter anthyllidis]MBT1159338.1 glycosyltransferase family 2 protein [Aminobacter anthyllidis]